MAYDKFTVWVLGGYGTFGARIVDMLAGENIHIIVAGRSRAKAERFCERYRGYPAKVDPETIDRTCEPDLAEIFKYRPQMVIDASGPFQAYGAQPYRLVEACIAHGAHYLDLADATDFVEGIRAHDAAARAAGVVVVSGVSSFPVLTAAAVRHMARDLKVVESIRGGIAPSPYAGFGTNVIRAIASYAGRPITVRRGGATAQGYAFTETAEMRIAPPGVRPLAPRLFGLVDVPDHAVLPLVWPEVREVWMGVAPVPRVMFQGLILASRLVRRGWLPGLRPFAPLLKLATDHLRWGEDRGGMIVSILGRTHDDRLVQRQWHMIAEGKDGPQIPSMAVPALVERFVAGDPPAPGARPAVAELELADYDRLFARRQIRTGFTGDALPGADVPTVPAHQA